MTMKQGSHRHIKKSGVKTHKTFSYISQMLWDAPYLGKRSASSCGELIFLDSNCPITIDCVVYLSYSNILGEEISNILSRGEYCYLWFRKDYFNEENENKYEETVKNNEAIMTKN